jgi:hypothetical protein
MTMEAEKYKIFNMNKGDRKELILQFQSEGRRLIL